MPRTTSRGFTLVELLAVVTITGILAMVGVSVFGRYVTSSKSAEATSVIQAIRAAEEAYIAENHVYMNASANGGGALWFPNTTPNRMRYDWRVPAANHLDAANWQQLAPAVNRTVQYGYLVNAGVAGVALPDLQLTSKPVIAVPVQDWYVIQAKGDTNGDGVAALYATTSMTGEIYSENEGE